MVQFLTRLIIIVIVFLCGFFTMFSQNNKRVIGKIILEKKDNFLVLRAKTQNSGLLYEDGLKYVFLALKKGEKGNYSSNKQQGDFSLQPNEGKILSQIRISLQKKEELKTYLFIRKKGVLIAKDSLFLNTSVKNNKKREYNEEAFFIKGIVVDEAITKIGKDFHDIFYQKYLLGGKKYPFVIKIKEKPGLGRSSILYVEAEDKKIYEFFAKPSEEYLKQHSKILLSVLFNHNAKRKRILKANKLY